MIVKLINIILNLSIIGLVDDNLTLLINNILASIILTILSKNYLQIIELADIIFSLLIKVLIAVIFAILFKAINKRRKQLDQTFTGFILNNYLLQK